MLAGSDVANVALDDTLSVDQIGVADKFHVDPLAAFGLQRQIFVTDVVVLLQYAERFPGAFNIDERTDIP